MSEAIICVLLGFGGHGLEMCNRHWFADSGDVRKLAAYAQGVSLIWVALAILLIGAGFPRKVILQILGMDALAALLVGAGVVAAHIVDGLVPEEWSVPQ